MADSCPHSLPASSTSKSASHGDTLEVKKDFQRSRLAINVKCKIVNVVEARRVWLISIISMIKVFSLLQSPSTLTCFNSHNVDDLRLFLHLLFKFITWCVMWMFSENQDHTPASCDDECLPKVLILSYFTVFSWNLMP